MGEKEKMLIALPCLIPTGGINVVVNMAKVLQKIGYHIELVSESDGEMRQAFEKLGIKVEIRQSVIEEDYVAFVIDNYNQVLVNTLQMYGMVHELNGTNVRVSWWIHEPPCYFKEMEACVPQELWDGLKENVEIYAAGNIVHNYISETYGKESKILNFGVTDYADTVEKLEPGLVSRDKITFLLPSITFQWIKGQDILALAIEELPEEYQKRTEFVFVGNAIQEMDELYKRILTLAYKRENVRIFKSMQRDRLLSMMKAVDCVVAPSREDATNSCIVEGLMLSKLCICSDMTGVSYYMEDCVNGFVFPTANVDELRTRIMLIVDNFERLNVIEQNGRKVYEQNFAMNIFEENVRRYWGRKGEQIK